MVYGKEADLLLLLLRRSGIIIAHRLGRFIHKWIAGDIPRGLANGLASEYNGGNSLTLRFPGVLPAGVFKSYKKRP